MNMELNLKWETHFLIIALSSFLACDLTQTVTRQVLPNEQEKGLEVELCMERLSSVKAICNIKLKWALIGCKALGLH